MNLFTKQKQTHKLRERTDGESCGEGIVREFGMDMYTLLYLKWITNEDLLYSPGMLHGSMDGKGIWRRMDTGILWLSLLAVHLKLSQHY